MEGQTVDQGQILVKADTTDWQDRITTLQHQLDSARANFVQAQAGITTSQYNLATAQYGLANAQYNLAAAQSNLATAQYNLKIQEDVKAAQDKIDNANIQLQQAIVERKFAASIQSGEYSYWVQAVSDHQTEIAKFEKDLQTLLSDPAIKGAPVTDINTRTTAVQLAQAGVEQVQAGIKQAQASVDQSKQNLELVQINLVVAQNNVDDAQTALNTEKNSLQVITAPIKGLITKVNVKQGDIVQRNANIIEIADPDEFEALIMVTERDVNSLTIGRDADVTFDSLRGMNFPAKITQIAPLATVQQGVVNYQVTVELTSTTPVSGAGSSALNTVPVNLKDGFSAVVNIQVLVKNNILIVPSRAITQSGTELYCSDRNRRHH